MHQRSNVVDEVFFALCKSVDTGLSLGAWLRYKYDKNQLVRMELQPSWYNTAHDFHRDFAVTSYLAKAEFLATGVDTRGVAIQRFRTAELACAQTNKRLQACPGVMPALDSILLRAQRKVADILGPMNIGRIAMLCKWGPGATKDIPRKRTGVDVKMTQTPSITSGAYPYGKAWLELDYVWFESITGHPVMGPYTVLPSLFSFTEQNRVVIVPKNAKTGRTIAAEPTWNSFFQQGIGRYIRRRLKAFGVHLNNQELNQNLASSALKLELATIDLSMASDTIARELVFMLLPLEWALLLDDLRSKEYNDPETGESRRYEKFSSMGNAFTFELESMIFAAVLVACYEEHTGLHRTTMPYSCSVYGDDLICPAVIAPRLIEVLGFLGFSTNIEKTHLDGQFRESCGKHYFGGHDVTPAYQKRNLLFEPELVRAGNRLFRLALRLGSPYNLDSTIYPPWAAMRRAADRTKGCWVPFGERDDGWLAPADLLKSLKLVRVRDRGLRCNVITSPRRFRPANERGIYAHTLYLNHDSESYQGTLGMISECAEGFRKEVIRKVALSHPSQPDVETDNAFVELEPSRRFKVRRRWVRSAVEFEAVWD